jgi:hypothetical protein
MYLDSFTSKNGDNYTLQSSGGTYYIMKGKETYKYSSDESYIRREFDDLKRSIGR